MTRTFHSARLGTPRFMRRRGSKRGAPARYGGGGMSDRPEPEPTPILASDADRERSVALLRDAVGEGRLTLEEFSERVGVAQAARTHKELAGLTRDLPNDPTRSAPAQSSWRSIFGTIDLDLRQARLAGPEIVLEVYNLFGPATVIVPEGVEVIVRGGGLVASQKLESPARLPIVEPIRLTIDTRGLQALLHVRTRPAPPTLKQSLKAVKARSGGERRSVVNGSVRGEKAVVPRGRALLRQSASAPDDRRERSDRHRKPARPSEVAAVVVHFGARATCGASTLRDACESPVNTSRRRRSWRERC